MRGTLPVLMLLATLAAARPLAAQAPPAPAPPDPPPPVSPVSPVSNEGRFGFGYQISLGGVQGFSLRYGMGPVVLGGIVGLTVFWPDAEDQDSVFEAEAAIIVAFPVLRWDGTQMGLGTRLAIATQNRVEPEEGAGVHPFGMAFELPLYGEVWLTRSISILLEAGFVMHVIGNDSSPILRQEQPGLAFLFGRHGLFGSAALTFYF